MFKLINKAKNKKGFTLVELLVVLAVLAIISAIAIPKFAGVQASAKKKADIESVKIIRDAIELCILTENVPSVANNNILIAVWSGSTVNFNQSGTPVKLKDNIEKYLKTTTVKLQTETSVDITLDKDGTVKYNPNITE